MLKTIVRLVQVVSLGIALFCSGEARAQQANPQLKSGQALEGLWTEAPHGLAFRIDTLADGRLILLQANPKDLNSYVGDIIGEARQTGTGEWIGRHAWGGRKSANRSWGQDGGLFIRRNSETELFVQYRDSKYAGGWTYERASNWQDEKDCLEEKLGREIVACTGLIDASSTSDQIRAFAYNKRGLGYLDLKDHEKALADFDEAIRLMPFYSDAFWGRSKAYASKGDQVRATADEAKAISLQPPPHGAIIRYGEGVMQMQRMRTDRAIDEFDRALKIDPGHLTSLTSRGLAYLALGEYERSLADFDRVAMLAPTDASAHNGKAWTLFKLGRLTLALESCNRSLELKRGAPNVDTLAHIQAALARYDEAVASYKEAARLGGVGFVRLYQRGLKQRGRFDGQIDGVATPAFEIALEACVRVAGCDPVPGDLYGHRADVR